VILAGAIARRGIEAAGHKWARCRKVQRAPVERVPIFQAGHAVPITVARSTAPTIRPFFEQAFAREHATIDFAGFSDEALHGVIQELSRQAIGSFLGSVSWRSVIARQVARACPISMTPKS
jgi:hypothetical protein